MKRAILVLSALLALSAGANAQTRSEKGQKADTQYQKVTRYDFDNDRVEGSILQPEDLLVPGRRLIKRSSLVRPRSNFVPEMIKSVEAL